MVGFAKAERQVDRAPVRLAGRRLRPSAPAQVPRAANGSASAGALDVTLFDWALVARLWTLDRTGAAQNIERACALSITTQAKPATAAHVNAAITTRRRRNERS